MSSPIAKETAAGEREARAPSSLLASRPGGSGPAAAESAALQSFWYELLREPWKFDFYYTLRRIEASNPRLPLLGRAGRPADEPVCVGQEPSLAFAPSTLAACEPAGGGIPPRVLVYHFGFWGPNGPLPQHLTEYARHRVRNQGDATLVRFVDILHQRLALLFYRGWAHAQSVVSLDRPQDDAFTRYVASLVGLGLPAQRHRDAVPDHAKLFNAGHLVRLTRNPEGLRAMLEVFFGAQVRVVEYVGHWLRLRESERTRLGAAGSNGCLGVAAVVGSSVWDGQSKFRLEIGPLALAEYERFLPVGRRFPQLIAWVRNYVGIELGWDVRLVLRRDQVPAAKLGGSQRLGWTTWIGQRRGSGDAGDLVLDCERWASRMGAAT